MPLISVILPVYNGEKTIRSTIESVLPQSFADFELIVINDGSQDKTLEIISAFDDPRIQVFSYPNAGVSASRNRGIAHAKGEYIALIDADDLWTPDKLEAQLNALKEHSHAAVAYSLTNYIDESGKILASGSNISVSGDVYGNLLLANFVENGSNVLIRAQALREVGGFNESLQYAEDWDLWLRLAARYHFVAVPSPQILYRIPINPRSVNLQKMETDTMLVIERAFTQIPQSLRYLKPFSKANIYKYLTYKAIESSSSSQTGFIAARFFGIAIKNDPSWLPKQSILLKIWFKITVVALLPPQQAQALMAKFPSLPKIHQLLLTYTRVEPGSISSSLKT
jgi:glycosyltransferase involved in cell wall biosynthesis